MAYILGQQGFWKLDLEVAPHTLIPRPDTELLVEAALELRAIALALANEHPGWQVTAVDRVPEAVALAERNRQRLGLDNVTVLHSIWFRAMSASNRPVPWLPVPTVSMTCARSSPRRLRIWTPVAGWCSSTATTRPRRCASCWRRKVSAKCTAAPTWAVINVSAWGGYRAE